MQTRQTYDFNSQDRHVNSRDHQQNSAVSPLLRYCHHHRLNDDGRTSATELHCNGFGSVYRNNTNSLV